MGSASGRGTSPEPLTPCISRWKYGIRFLYRIDSCGYVREYRNLEGKGEIGDKVSPEPQVVAILFCCVTECMIVVMNEWKLYHIEIVPY